MIQIAICFLFSFSSGNDSHQPYKWHLTIDCAHIFHKSTWFLIPIFLSLSRLYLNRIHDKDLSYNSQSIFFTSSFFFFVVHIDLLLYIFLFVITLFLFYYSLAIFFCRVIVVAQCTWSKLPTLDVMKVMHLWKITRHLYMTAKWKFPSNQIEPMISNQMVWRSVHSLKSMKVFFFVCFE